MTSRYYTSTALPTILSSALGASGNPSVPSLPGTWPTSYPFAILIDWGLPTQEALLVTSAPTGSGPYTLPCTRGVDGTTAQAHAANAVVVHGTTSYEPTLLQTVSSGSTGTVTSVTATDASIVVSGTDTVAPTIATGTLDVVATQHPPAAAWSNNNWRITNLGNGSAEQDAAAFGQLPSSGSPLPTLSGGTGTGSAAANAVFAGPVSGSPGAPSFRGMVSADVPNNAANTTGNAATATTASGLTSATTTVSVSSATAPASGQVLTATSSTAADWQTPSGGGSSTLAGDSDVSISSPSAGQALVYNGTAWENISGLEALEAIGSSGSTKTVNVVNGAVQTVTLSADCTFTFTNPPGTPSSAAWSFTLVLIQDSTGSRTAAFTGGSTMVYWQDGIPPSLSTAAGAIDVLVFTTYNGGSFWLGSVAGLNYMS